MDCVAGRAVEENVFAVSVAETGRTRLGGSANRQKDSESRAHPSTNPTIEMTAAVREYARRARCHADGSGKFSRNHSWKTEGNLRPNRVSIPSGMQNRRAQKLTASVPPSRSVRRSTSDHSGSCRRRASSLRSASKHEFRIRSPRVCSV